MKLNKFYTELDKIVNKFIKDLEKEKLYLHSTELIFSKYDLKEKHYLVLYYEKDNTPAINIKITKKFLDRILHLDIKNNKYIVKLEDFIGLKKGLVVSSRKKGYTYWFTARDVNIKGVNMEIKGIEIEKQMLLDLVKELEDGVLRVIKEADDHLYVNGASQQLFVKSKLLRLSADIINFMEASKILKTKEEK